MKHPKVSPIKKALIGIIAICGGMTLYFTACQHPAPSPVAQPAQPSSAMASERTNNNGDNETAPTVPTTGIKKVNFPIYLDNVPSILHPITPVEGQEKSSKMASKSSFSRFEDTSTNYFRENSPYNFTGNIYNLVFEDINTGATQRLFPKDNFVIISMVAPYTDLPLSKTLQNALKADPSKNATNDVTENEPKNPEQRGAKSSAIDKKLMGYFIYQVKEKPTKDKDDDKSNLYEQVALYLSDGHGKNLLKLHPNGEYVKSVEWLPELERYYFITQNDSNGDNIIDIKDTYHNYVIDFKKARETQTLPQAVEYNFMK